MPKPILERNTIVLTKSLTVRLPENTVAELQRYSKFMNLSASAIITAAVTYMMATHNEFVKSEPSAAPASKRKQKTFSAS